MNIIKKLVLFSLTGTFALCGVLLATPIAFAQTNTQMLLTITQSGNAHITGNVTAVSGNAISIASWGGTWTINAQGATIPSGISTISVGDIIMVNGTITGGMNIQAKNIIDKTPKQIPKTATAKKISGVISSLNTTAGTLTLTTIAGNINIATDSSTKVYLANNLSTFASLSNGLTATAFGSYTASTNTITATMINAPASPITLNWPEKFKRNFKGIFKLFAQAEHN